MSKSRGNVIEPGEQIKNFGADSLRVYLCFMGPYDQGGPWNPQGIVGVRRFLDRVFSLYQIKKRKKEKKDKNLEKLLHQTIKKVTEDLENFRFNTAVSALMILVNQMATNFPTKDQLKTLLLLLAPFAPHLTEELWQKHYLSSAFSPQRSIHNQPWPKYDPRLVKEEKIILIVQVNGKVRDRIESRADLSKKEALSLALSSKKVQKWIEGKKPKKVIFVKGKLINLVI
jgi:leucyl-tRNA synthetase